MELELCPGRPVLLKVPLCLNSNKCLVRSLAWNPLRVLALLYCRGFSGVFGPALEELSPSPTVVRGASLQEGTELAVS